MIFEEQKKDLISYLRNIETSMNNFSIEIRRRGCDAKDVHLASQIIQKFVSVKDIYKKESEQKENMKKDLYAKTFNDQNNVFKQQAILHSLFNEYMLNDGIIDQNEYHMLNNVLEDLENTVSVFKKSLLEFAEFCKE